jgi:hypothetical protein
MALAQVGKFGRYDTRVRDDGGRLPLSENIFRQSNLLVAASAAGKGQSSLKNSTACSPPEIRLAVRTVYNTDSSSAIISAWQKPAHLRIA